MDYGQMFSALGPVSDEDLNRGSASSGQTLPNAGYYNTFSNDLPWEEAWKGFKSRPILYNIEGYMSPYTSDNWTKTNVMLADMDDRLRIPIVEDRIDPNRILNAELNSLNVLAADQAKTLKMFERRFNESITEKGKYGLTEEDIEAMAAITSARAAIVSITKERSAIKKNMAELKIKQAANSGAVAASNAPQAGKPGDNTDFGLLMLDNIFKTPDAPVPGSIPTTSVGYTQTTGVGAADIIDAVVPEVAEGVRNEANGITIYAVADNNTSDDFVFEAYDKNGVYVPDVSIAPDLKVVQVNRESDEVIDNRNQVVPIKYRDSE